MDTNLLGATDFHATATRLADAFELAGELDRVIAGEPLSGM
jgi:hypothetical protein